MHRSSFLFTLRMTFFFLVAVGVAPAAADWLDPAWSHRVEFTAKQDRIEDGGPFSDITLLLTIDADSLGTVFDVAKSDGSDLVVTAGDGTTVLEHEIVSYDPVGREAEIWFLAPVFSSVDNVFHLYYGNPDTTVTPTTGAAWSPEHIGVFHFEDDPGLGILSDSGPHGNFATAGQNSQWTSSDVIDGQIGQGWLFNGETHWIDADNVSSPDSSFTISAWFACSNLNKDANFAFSVEEGFWHLSAKRNGSQKYPDFAAGANFFRWNPELTDNDLHHFTWVMDGVNDTIQFWFDGVKQSGFAYVPDPNDRLYTGLTIQGNVGIAGPLYGQNNPFDMMEGTVDEFRIFVGAQSEARVVTEYRNQADGPAFYTYRPQQLQTVSVDPMGLLSARVDVWPNPFRGTADISVETAHAGVEVSVYDVAGRLVRRLRAPEGSEGALRLQWDGRDAEGRRASNGLYFVRAIAPEGVLGSAKVLYLR